MSRKTLLTIVSISLFIALASILWRHLTSTPFTSPIADVNMAKESKFAIVVGSGLAGLSAASTLIANGTQVTLFERSLRPGGNSIKASSGINGAPTRYQPGPPFSDSFFYADTIASSGSVFTSSSGDVRQRREKLTEKLVNDSAGCIEWLVKKGVDLSAVAQLGGHSFPRTHRGAGKTPPGYAIVSTLLNELKTSPLFKLQTSCVVTKVLKFGRKVEGVEYFDADGEENEARGPVIFATGGFAGDANGLLATYRPDLEGFPSTNDARPGSQPLLTAIGAQLLDMSEVQVHPTAFVDPKDVQSPVKFLAAELLRGEGGLLLYGGKRFINEMQTRKVVTDAIKTLPLAEGSPRQWDVQLVLDEGVYQNASSHIDFYIIKGLIRKTTLSELDPDAKKTVKEYSIAAAGEAEDKLGRTYFGHWELKSDEVSSESVVYIGRVTPAVHFTMGGVVINELAEVLDADGEKIHGVWAAGEVAGGVHGENRLGGSSLLECCVFGRVAANELVKYIA
ncbi:Flavocytochrome c [Hyaloscypha variabilis F]|uniref:Fumarate reductase n=1 Tax=Hyaloscypha variabilis (strain UAMH 11265 / GT02V1 / F) TaxID=1149755 RepID=A0A2J6RS21_HYAVF|nr:Flavocytochrome c [Hyaloscypha variabilis F]